ncbi:Methionine gamma-lyase [Phocoenobacter uteri]|uniref:Methionine gamma-lyase n=1 Tax=Phocoenobacter uteri TaxID=146806 RepID=A0A379C9G3_9PAST|nr:O-acetylhomoserine aminocarboxypropyltransferase/cysteine synthase family protein [Phocoenobacter uteri]MDG6881004.1 O-acetylhomoserine aminocarboxypropyltransferase [Phocoenobacter uteri]SUB59022.1 Methionine gamma-lyase [Phocoenobacter uteri]
MTNTTNFDIATQCVKGTYQAGNTEPMVAPIIQSTTYRYDSSDSLAAAFNLEQATPIYTRIGNPTLSVLEEKLALLEKGIAAVTTASGQAAVFYSIANIAQAGDHIIALSNLYGGTYTLLSGILKQLGIKVTFVEPSASVAEIVGISQENTKLIFAETIGNPCLDVLDFENVSRAAKQIDIPLIVDNTFATPYLCNPKDFGANIIVHSTTKYLDGHATSLGGVVIDCGNFNWNNGKFPGLSEPNEAYHDLIYTETFGDAAYAVKLRTGLLRDIGATLAPFNAFLTNLGTETLHLRMERHSSNALAVAQFLEKHPKVEWVNYPHLASSPSYDLAKKYLSRGGSGVVSFGIKGGSEAAKKFIDTMQLAMLVTHVGDLRTFAIHPASTTHRQLSDEALEKAGITPNLIRYNVGIEHIDDILRDIEQTLSQI